MWRRQEYYCNIYTHKHLNLETVGEKNVTPLAQQRGIRFHFGSRQLHQRNGCIDTM